MTGGFVIARSERIETMQTWPMASTSWPGDAASGSRTGTGTMKGRSALIAVLAGLTALVLVLGCDRSRGSSLKRSGRFSPRR